MRVGDACALEGQVQLRALLAAVFSRSERNVYEAETSYDGGYLFHEA
jgi:hypothetical protein